jgi:hypothetical protein
LSEKIGDLGLKKLPNAMGKLTQQLIDILGKGGTAAKAYMS